MRNIFALLLLVMVLGCDDNVTGPRVPLNAEFVLARGDAVAIENADAQVRFTGVTNDSRCPADAVCIQGGDAHVNIAVTVSGRTRDHVLHTGDMKPVTQDDLTIHLVQVAPYPFSSRTIAPDDYRVTLRVTR
jgi:hypothetical protein